MRSLFLLLAFIAKTEQTPKLDEELVQRELASIRIVITQTSGDPIQIADAHYFLGKYEPDKKLAEKHFETAVELSEDVLKQKPKNPLALLAWCAAKGELAQMRNPFTALGYIKPIEQRFLLLKEVAQAHDGFVADRALGRLYQLAPSIISIGSTKKAKLHLKAALDGAPDHPGNQLYWALFLQEKGEIEEARTFAKKALDNPLLPKANLERFDWIKLAQKLLEQTAPKAP